MKRKQLIEFNKRIVLDEERMRELNGILAEYCDKIRYQGETVDHQTIEFDSFDELMDYPNFDKEQLQELWICGAIEHDWRAIDIRISNKYFLKTIVCNYMFSNDAHYFLFGKKLRDLFNKSTEYHRSYIACKVFTYIAVITAPLLAMILCLAKQRGLNTGNIAVLPSVAMILAFASSMINKVTWDRIFPKVTFAWGEEKRRYNKKAKLLSNLFWGVIVAAVISIGCSAIFAG